MLRTNAFKQALNAAGLALSILSIVYVFYTQRESISLLVKEITTIRLFLIFLSTLFISFCIYFASSLAWRMLVNQISNISKMTSFFVVCQSQIHKYVVGNFMHHVTRALLMNGYVSMMDYGKLVFLESGLLTLAGIFLLCGFLFADLYMLEPALVLLITFLVPFICSIFATKKYRFYFLVTGLHASTFVLNCLCLLAIIVVLGGEIDHPLIILFAFTAAFLSGFLALGSPGGIGIRELVFLLVIAQAGLNEAFFFQVITLHRVATILCDIAVYFVSKQFRHASQ
ncbi:MAG: hypothetical protein AAGJ37_12740 [Pseudomonadota bacterium]